jgi:hypothetical protein
MWSGIHSVQGAAASPAISRLSPCLGRLCYTRCYTQAAVSTSQPTGAPIHAARSPPRLGYEMSVPGGTHLAGAKANAFSRPGRIFAAVEPAETLSATLRIRQFGTGSPSRCRWWVAQVGSPVHVLPPAICRSTWHRLSRSLPCRPPTRRGVLYSGGRCRAEVPADRERKAQVPTADPIDLCACPQVTPERVGLRVLALGRGGVRRCRRISGARARP